MYTPLGAFHCRGLLDCRTTCCVDCGKRLQSDPSAGSPPGLGRLSKAATEPVGELEQRTAVPIPPAIRDRFHDGLLVRGRVRSSAAKTFPLSVGGAYARGRFAVPSLASDRRQGEP